MKWRCTECGEEFTSDEMESDFYIVNQRKKLCICPDCMDNIERMDEDDKFDYLMEKGDGL